MTQTSPWMTVRLRESTVAALMTLRQRDDEPLDAVIARQARASAPPQPATPPVITSVAPAAQPDAHPTGGKYAVQMLGETMWANTLPEVFARVIDVLDCVDPAALDRLTAMKAKKRGFVSRDRAHIHPGRPDLPVLRTASGWWISANIGTNELEQRLEAACAASGLRYGADIRFPAPLSAPR